MAQQVNQVNQVSKASSMAARLEAAFEAWSSVDTSRTVFLGELPLATNRNELLETLSIFGNVHKLVLPKEPKTKKLKGHGKAVYFDPEGARAALAAKVAMVGGQRFEIKEWVDPLTYIHQRDMKAHRKVYVKHKSVHTKEILLHYFQQFGAIEEIDMRFNFNSNRSRNFCYIIFRNHSSALMAASGSHELMGQIVLCEMCRPTNPLGTITILPSDNNLENDYERTRNPEKVWQTIKQIQQKERQSEHGSLVWDLQMQKASRKEKEAFTCTEFRQIAQNGRFYPVSLSSQPRNRLTSLSMIPNRLDIGGQAIGEKKVYGCNDPEPWFPPSPDLYRLPSIDTKQEDHFIKPTSRRYSKQKTSKIELLHRENENVFFKKIKPLTSSDQRPAAEQGYRRF